MNRIERLFVTPHDITTSPCIFRELATTRLGNGPPLTPPLRETRSRRECSPLPGRLGSLSGFDIPRGIGRRRPMTWSQKLAWDTTLPGQLLRPSHGSPASDT